MNIESPVGQWSIQHEGEWISVGSSRELRATLERLSHERPPVAVSVVSPTEKVMVIGLGRDKSVLLFQASDDPPYFQSVGDHDNPGVILFKYGGQETELSLEAAIDPKTALQAAAEFFETDERPKSVDWEEV
jgi:hypothetical protein